MNDSHPHEHFPETSDCFPMALGDGALKANVASRLRATAMRALSCGVLMLAATACGDGSEGSEQNPTASSAILLVERVFAPEGRFYYASVVDEIPNGPIDRSRAREFTSADFEAYRGAFYVRDRESSIITRFTISERLELVEEESFSMQTYGLPPVRLHNVYLSPERAYLIDKVGLRLIEWNPSAMELTGNELSIDYVAKEGLPDLVISPPVQAGDRIISSVSWEDFENQEIHPGTGALIFDPDSSEPPLFVEDARTAGAYKVNEDERDAYVSGIVTYALYSTTPGGDPVPPSGILRIPDGDASFDSEYFIDLSALTGSPGVYGVHRIDERYLLVQMFDPAAPVADYPTADDFFAAPEYLYALVDAEEVTWTLVDEIPKAGAGNTLDHNVDGRLYVQAYEEVEADVSDAIVYEVSPDGIEEAFRVPSGDLWYLQRAR